MYIYGIYRSCCHDDSLPILPENGLSNRIRGLFENAIATETGARCPLFWRMYIHFLVRLLTQRCTHLLLFPVLKPQNC